MCGWHWHVLSHTELQLRLAIHNKGIGKIGGVSRLVIIVAVVTQQGADTLALCIQLGHDKRVVAMNLSLIHGSTDQTVCMTREVKIAYAVNHIESPWGDSVLYLGGLGILLLYRLEAYLTMEIAMITQHILCNRRAQLGINP